MRPAVPLRLNARSRGGSIDDAVAPHAARQQQFARRHEPVADVRRQPSLFARPGDLCSQLLSPHVIQIDGDPQPVIAQRVAEVIAFTQARSAAYIGCSGSMTNSSDK
jgi:hypothetical protein